MARTLDPPADGAKTDSLDPPDVGGVDDLECVIVAGPDAGRALSLGRGRHIVGKSGATLALSDGGVSRQHLEIEVTDDTIVVRDLGSRNGTYYLGARIETAAVAPGAVLTVGGNQLKIRRR